MPNGVRDMGSNTVTNLFLTIGMLELKTSFPLITNPKKGCLMFDDHIGLWVFFNGKKWIHFDMKNYSRKSLLEKLLYGKDLDEKSVQE